MIICRIQARESQRARYQVSGAGGHGWRAQRFRARLTARVAVALAVVACPPPPLVRLCVGGFGGRGVRVRRQCHGVLGCSPSL